MQIKFHFNRETCAKLLIGWGQIWGKICNWILQDKILWSEHWTKGKFNSFVTWEIWLLLCEPLWHSTFCSTVAASGWGCMNISTWEVKWLSWGMTAPTSWNVTTSPTLTPATWLMATGLFTSSPTTGGVTTTWNPASIRVSVTGGATTPGWVPSGDWWIFK